MMMNMVMALSPLEECKVYNTKKPKDWDDLFSKFPSGHGILKKVSGKNLTGVSMYDHPVFSKYLIEELTPGLINDYVDEFPRSWGTKRKMIYALQGPLGSLKEIHGDKQTLKSYNQRRHLKLNFQGVSKSKNSKYNREKMDLMKCRKCG